MRDAAEPPPTAGFDRKKLLWLIGSLVLVVAMFWFVLPQVANLSDVWREIRAMTPLELGILAIFTAWNLVTYWIVMVIATPGLTYGQAIVVTEASTAVANTIPGGSAIAIGLTYSMLGSWGFSKSRATVSVVVSGIWNNFVKLGMPVVALVLLAFQGQAGGGRMFAGLAGVAGLIGAVTVFAFILRSDDFAVRIGEGAARILALPRRLLRRPPATGWGDAVATFRNRVIGLVRASWIKLTIATLVGHASLFVVLLITLRDVGVSNSEVGWAEALAVFAFVRLLTAIPLTPGGIGIIELGLIGGLTSAGGDHAQVVATVLVFRVLTYILPIPFGAVTYLFWRRNKSWIDSAPPLEPASVATVAPTAA